MTTFYIDMAGIDSAARNGTTQPWLTLHYACTRVTTPGDIIHVNAGTYEEGNFQSTLANGVSLEGVAGSVNSLTSIIRSTYKGSIGLLRDATLKLDGINEGTAEGNQSIRYIKFDGRYTWTNGEIPNGTTIAGAKSAIVVHCRSNVEISNCYFINFYFSAVNFYGGTSSWSQEPPIEGIYATGNSYHHNESVNCSLNYKLVGTWSNTGHLWVQGQKNFLIYSNDFTQTQRAFGWNGMCIKATEGFYKAMKIYDNNMYQTPTSLEVGFSIEIWYARGGIEVYGNTFPMQLDFARGIIKGEYLFAAQIHNNTIGHPTIDSQCESPFGIMLEWDVQDVFIYKNFIQRFRACIAMYSAGNKSSIFERIYIYYNILCNTSSGGASVIDLWQGPLEADNPSAYNGIYIYHNVLAARPGGGTYGGINLPTYDHINGIYIRNNIMTNGSIAPIRGVQPICVVYNLVITDNIFYNNASNNPDLLPNYRIPAQGYIYERNQVGIDPRYVNPTMFDFTLQANSPAIDQGFYVGIISDYIENAVSIPPEIGAYEFNSVPLPDPDPYVDIVIQNAQLIKWGVI